MAKSFGIHEFHQIVGACDDRKYTPRARVVERGDEKNSESLSSAQTTSII